ncbi:MAG: hypothetical protein PF443_07955, partial [Allgaiera sp.]|nr:hypothetical protein [Allgaiera sp.]
MAVICAEAEVQDLCRAQRLAAGLLHRLSYLAPLFSMLLVFGLTRMRWSIIAAATLIVLGAAIALAACRQAPGHPPDTPASAKVAMPSWAASAARSTPSATA